MIDVTDRPADQPTELLDRQRALQAEAEQVRAQLDLERVLGSVGDPVVVGSAALGLMTWRDLDITIVCPSLDRRQVLGVGTELAGHQDVKALQYRNDTGRWNQEPEKYPDGLYLGLCYHPPELPEWKLDLWFVDDPARQPDLGHLRTLPGRLTDDARLAILRIKTLWSARPQDGTSVRSWDIYTAVLDHGVRSTDEFNMWLTGKLPRSPWANRSALPVASQIVSGRLIQTEDDGLAWTCEAAGEAEGQAVWTRLSPQVTGRRLVSFLVSYMFVYLRPSPSTTGR